MLIAFLAIQEECEEGKRFLGVWACLSKACLSKQSPFRRLRASRRRFVP